MLKKIKGPFYLINSKMWILNSILEPSGLLSQEHCSVTVWSKVRRLCLKGSVCVYFHCLPLPKLGLILNEATLWKHLNSGSKCCCLQGITCNLYKPYNDCRVSPSICMALKCFKGIPCKHYNIFLSVPCPVLLGILFKIIVMRRHVSLITPCGKVWPESSLDLIKTRS